MRDVELRTLAGPLPAAAARAAGPPARLRELVQRGRGQYNLLRDACPDTVRSWAEQTEPDFRLLLKLPKAITHERRLADPDGPLRAFLDVIEPLGPRVHALWCSCRRPSAPRTSARWPPSCTGCRAGSAARSRSGTPRSSRTRAGSADWRASSAASAPSGWPSTPPSCSPALRPARGTGGVGEEAPAAPQVPGAHRPSGRPLHRPGRRAAHAEGWRHWTGAVADWLREGRSPTVFIHTPDNDESLGLARLFHDEVGAGSRSSNRCPSRSPPVRRRSSEPGFG